MASRAEMARRRAVLLPTRHNRSYSPPSGRELVVGPGRDLNLDSQGRGRPTPIHFDLHLVALDRHVLSDQREDLLAQDLDQPGLANGDTLMREKNLQPLASGNGRTLRLGDRRRAGALEKAKQPHAALRMNSVLKKLFRSLGTLMVRVSPLRRRA